MAIKDAAKASPLDTNRAIASFYFHRLLYRVFSEPGTPFVLKGGQGMLARTADARATRDIDLATDRPIAASPPSFRVCSAASAPPGKAVRDAARARAAIVAKTRLTSAHLKHEHRLRPVERRHLAAPARIAS